jgi:hypothetical protein
MLALVTRLVVLENGSVVADGPRDTVLKMLRDKAGVPKADVGKTHQVQNIVIPQPPSEQPIRVAEVKPLAGNSDAKQAQNNTSGTPAKKTSKTASQNDNGKASSKAPKPKKAEATK